MGGKGSKNELGGLGPDFAGGCGLLMLILLRAPNRGSNTRTVMGKYYMGTKKEDILGEGAYSICHRGTVIDGGKQVAIKVYKSKKVTGTTLDKYKRQIEVLKELLKDFDESEIDNPQRYWHERFDRGKIKPTDVFMELIGHSMDRKGVPGPDPRDNQLYVVSEMAQYSMKDFLALRRAQDRALSESSIKQLADAILLALTGLHAKGLVHVDFKPANIMMFDGKLKVIDVDGCVQAGSKVAITDSSISFSPCYCSPERAKFLTDESNSNIIVDRALDAWSVGMTICELVTLDAVLKPMHASFTRNGNRNHQQAGFLFMEWLSTLKKPPIPKKVAAKKDFADLCGALLNPAAKKRMSCAEALNHPYCAVRDTPANSTDLGRIFKKGGG